MSPSFLQDIIRQFSIIPVIAVRKDKAWEARIYSSLTCLVIRNQGLIIGSNSVGYIFIKQRSIKCQTNHYCIVQ